MENLIPTNMKMASCMGVESNVLGVLKADLVVGLMEVTSAFVITEKPSKSAS